MKCPKVILVSIVFILCWEFSSVLVAQSVSSSTSEVVVGEQLPTGKSITPTAARGAIFQDLNPQHALAPDGRANGPASLAVSPDGKLLAILTTGFNQFYDRNGKSSPELTSEYVFLFDITGAQPRQLEVLPLRDSFQGLAWSPSSDRLFASGGTDDAVTEFVCSDSHLVVSRVLRLGHKSWVGRDTENLLRAHMTWDCMGCTREQARSLFGAGWSGEVAGLAVSPDGIFLLVTNIMNDSVSLIDIATGRVIAEQDLRPGIIDPKRHGQPGGSYPRAVVWTSASRAYVASERDREIISLAVLHDKLRVVHRMSVQGQPVALVANHSGSRVYVALDTSNRVAIFDTETDKQIESFDAAAPVSVYANSKMLGGGNTNALALTPDQRLLLVSNGGENAIAVVRLSDVARGVAGNDSSKQSRQDDDGDDFKQSTVVGLVPTGWYPSGVGTSKDGSKWYVVNGKSPTGPNVSWCNVVDPIRKLCIPSHQSPPDQEFVHIDPLYLNQHLEQLEKAGLLTMPTPPPLELAHLTKQVAHNNAFDRPDKTEADERLFSFLREHIKHVIYIMKENLSYDLVLGDLKGGNGDSRFTLYPEKITPNHHAIARNFVDLDNTLVSGEGSPQGWTWTYAAQINDYEEWNEPRVYIRGQPGRGVYSDFYGENRGINMGYATSEERHAQFPGAPSDPDILPGIHDVNAPDGPGGLQGKGYIWDAALRRGLTVRNYGNAANPWNYEEGYFGYPFVRDPYASKQKVFWTASAALMPYTDPYFYAFNPAYPDFWRIKEWKREFDEFSETNSAPNLIVMWLANDHTGYFDKAIDGVDTPETQVADNDYALGLLIEAVSNSPFAKDTLVVSVEDDAFNGPDHVDSHRTVTLLAGPYLRQHAVVSTRYTTVSVVKTIEEILGIGPIGLNDALAAPMSDVFDVNAASWSYKAIVPNVLRSTKLPLPPDDHAKIEYPKHSAAYWVKAMAGQDFSGPDRIDPVSFNRALWHGLKGSKSAPVTTKKETTVAAEQ